MCMCMYHQSPAALHLQHPPTSAGSKNSHIFRIPSWRGRSCRRTLMPPRMCRRPEAHSAKVSGDSWKKGSASLVVEGASNSPPTRPGPT